MRALLAIIGKSLLWGITAGIIGLLGGLFGACFLLETGNLCGLWGFLLGPAAFIVVTWLVLLWQVRRALMLPKWATTVYVVIVILLFVPILKTIELVDLSAPIVVSSGVPSREERMRGTPALTDTERQLLKATHFNLTVAVRHQTHPPSTMSSPLR